jgi:hypothetical protein
VDLVAAVPAAVAPEVPAAGKIELNKIKDLSKGHSFRSSCLTLGHHLSAGELNVPLSLEPSVFLHTPTVSEKPVANQKTIDRIVFRKQDHCLSYHSGILTSSSS